MEQTWRSTDGVRQGLPQGYYSPNTFGNNFVDASDTVLLYSPTQRSGSLSFMVSSEVVRLRRQRFGDLQPFSFQFKMSESYSQGAEPEWDDDKRSIAGVHPFEPFPSVVETLSAAGGSTVQIGGIQVPLWTLPLAPQRVLVPQRKYGIRTSSKRGFHPEPPIKFSVENQDGMSLQDAMDEKYEGLIGRDDGMFLGCDCTAISLRIEVMPFWRSLPFFADEMFLMVSSTFPHSGPSTRLGTVMYVYCALILGDPHDG